MTENAKRVTILLLAGFMGLSATAAYARDYKVGSVVIADPWSRATPKGAKVAAGYMKITNNGATPDRLIGGSADVAPKLEVHDMTMDRGVMMMRPVKGGLEIKPGETVELKPDSYHLMFLGLQRPLAKGEDVKATLEFEKAGKGDVTFEVRAVGAPMGKM